MTDAKRNSSALDTSACLDRELQGVFHARRVTEPVSLRKQIFRRQFPDSASDNRMTLVLGNAIRAARARKNLKQRDLAEALGVTRAAVGQWEAGSNEPSAQNLIKLSEILELNLSTTKSEPKYIVSAGIVRDTEDKSKYNLYADHSSVGFDVPVSHIVMSDDGRVHDLTGRSGLVFVRRFDFFDEIPDVFAVLFTTNVLSPRYENGSIAYVAPNQQPVAGGYALLTVGDPAGADGDGLQYQIARRVIYIDSERVIATQFRPERQQEIPFSVIQRVDRLVSEKELMVRRGK